MTPLRDRYWAGQAQALQSSGGLNNENILPNNVDGMQRAFYNPAMSVTSVIMVCTENICRSPMAEGLMRQRVAELGLQKTIRVDSAGTQVSQPRQKPDARAIKVMSDAGIPLRGIKARKVNAKDLARNDHVIAMDSANYNTLIEFCNPDHRHKIVLLPGMSAESGPVEIPDPYYGNLDGFTAVYRLLDGAIDRLLRQVGASSD